MARRSREEITVKVAKTGTRVEEFVLEAGATVSEALEAAGYSSDEDSRVRINGKAAELDDELEDGDRVTLSGNIKGGC